MDYDCSNSSIHDYILPSQSVMTASNDSRNSVTFAAFWSNSFVAVCLNIFDINILVICIHRMNVSLNSTTHNPLCCENLLNMFRKYYYYICCLSIDYWENQENPMKKCTQLLIPHQQMDERAIKREIERELTRLKSPMTAAECQNVLIQKTAELSTFEREKESAQS